MTQSHGTQDLNGSSLLPCPFCGKQPKLNDYIAEGKAEYVSVSCGHPVSDGPDGHDDGTLTAEACADTRDLAIAAWNRRSEPSEPVAWRQIDALEPFLRVAEHVVGHPAQYQGTLMRTGGLATAADLDARQFGRLLEAFRDTPLYASPNPGEAK